ncbi:MAG: 50S ribosomal protein L35 [Candidatus Omnitrophota bacterium]
MPKLKTRKGVAKRFKRTGTGKFKRSKANKGHLKTSKNMKRKRRLRKPAMVHKSDQKRILSNLPY